jgi:hypothetical protein
MGHLIAPGLRLLWMEIRLRFRPQRAEQLEE